MIPNALRAWTVAVGVAGVGAGFARGVPPTTPNGTTATRPAAMRPALESVIATAVRDAVGGAPLTFGTDAGPARFELMLTFVVPAKGAGGGGPAGLLTTHYVVARDGDDVAVLALAADGAPYAYAAKDLLAGFDPAEPGRLILYDRGAPGVTVGVNPQSGNFAVEVSFRGAAGAAALSLEIEPVLRAALSKLEVAAFDPVRRVVKLETRNTTVGLFLPLPPAADGSAPEAVLADPPIRGLVVRSRGGVAMALSNIRTDRRSSILGRRRADFEKLGLPTRAADGRSPKVPLFVPPAFGRDPRERQAAERLRAVFPGLKFEPVVTPSTPLEREGESKV